MEFFIIVLFIYFVVQIVHYKIYGEFLTNKKAASSTSNSYPYEEVHINEMIIQSRKNDANIQKMYVYLAGWLMKQNARDSKRKIDFVRMYLQRNFKTVYPETMQRLIAGMRYETNIRSIAKWIIHRMNSGEERIKIIDYLFEIVKADGDIIDREFVSIVRFAELIGVKASYVDKKMQEFQNTKFKNYQNTTYNSKTKRSQALLILHLTEGFDEAQLKRAYRKLAVKYHPDKQIDASEADKELANQKFIEIQEAYDFLSSK